ncbi:MAG: hypothetical protein M3Q23_01630 [Actinomycetota bacterium]|nr:hypothetical protein [Actinomycetota bacterium]
MIRRLAVLPLATALLVIGVIPVSASTEPTPTRYAVVLLIRGASFEQLVRSNRGLLRTLARAGGAGLMSPRTVAGDRGPGAYLTLGTGVRSAAPEVRVRGSSRGSERVLPQLSAYIAANEGQAIPGLLASVLEAHGLRTCLGQDSSRFVGPGLLMAMDRWGQASFAPTSPDSPDCALTVEDDTFTTALGLHGMLGSLGGYFQSLYRPLGMPISTNPRLLVIVVEARPSAAMDRAKDELAPIVLAEGSPSELFRVTGPMHTLTSDTTRRVGVVSNEDVAPTILRFFGIAVPPDMNGSPIRFDDGPAPFALHAKHLENRRATVPIQIGAGIAVTVMGLVALLLLAWRTRVPPGLKRVAPALPLMALPLGVAVLAAGRLPHETYAWTVPFLVAVTVAGGVAAFALTGHGSLMPPAALGAAAVAFFVVEALQGWPDTPFTLLGGSALDGARFYGLPNNMIGLLMASGLWVAAILRPYPGFLFLLGLALFVGFPDLGANLGGALTLLVAAALWLVLRPLRPGRRLRWRDAAVAAGVVVAGMAVVLAAQVVLASTPTHGTRFVENSGSNGIGHVVATLGDRLLIGWRLLLRDPFAFVPVLGLPVTLAVLLRPPPVLRLAFDRRPEWRTALIVLVMASIVAYVVNDTGPAAVGLGWGLAVAGILYLPLWETSRSTVPTPAGRPAVPA